MQKQEIEKEERKEMQGEDFLQEYFEQDKDDKHNMGYGVYGQTTNDGCCC